VKPHCMFSIMLYEKAETGLSCAIPDLPGFLGAMERDVRSALRERSAPEAPRILEDPLLSPIRTFFTEQVAEVAQTSPANVQCVRSWCLICRDSEYVFFDQRQWWRHPQPSIGSGLHNHLPFHFTGVYYVSIPAGTNQPISFLNPLPSSFGHPDWFEFHPRSEMFLLFESHLWHRVLPARAAVGDRICLSMDALVLA